MTEHFTKRWEKSSKKDKQVNQITNAGDVVLIHEENTAKMIFKLSIIDSFKPSRGSAKRIENVHYLINGKLFMYNGQLKNFVQ